MLAGDGARGLPGAEAAVRPNYPSSQDSCQVLGVQSILLVAPICLGLVPKAKSLYTRTPITQVYSLVRTIGISEFCEFMVLVQTD